MPFARLFIAFVAAGIGLILVTPVFLVLLPFWIISFLTRLVTRVLQPGFVTIQQLIEFDPVFGWKPRPNLNTHHLMVDLFQLKTDEDGWRGRHTLDESEVVVFGDSFAAGYGVSDHHLFANLTVTPKIKPIGIGGYSMVQALLWMERLAPVLQGKVIVWFIYYGNDLSDNLVPDLRGYRRPFVREDKTDGDWEIVSHHVTPEQWPIVTQGRMQGETDLPRLAQICSDTFLAERAYSACEFLIRTGQQVCTNAGAQLLVLPIPDASQLTPEGRDSLKALASDGNSFDPDLPDRRLETVCERLGLRFLAGASFLDTSCYKTDDCHWNEKGHRKISEMLTRLYHEQKRTRQVEESKV